MTLLMAYNVTGNPGLFAAKQTTENIVKWGDFVGVNT